MAAKVIILVTDKDDDKHGEISIVDNMGKAERLVETLIEAGFEQERVRVFSGSELEIQVMQRPVVSLVRPEAGSDGTPEAEGQPGEAKGAPEEGVPFQQGSGFRLSSLFRSDEPPQ